MGVKIPNPLGVNASGSVGAVVSGSLGPVGPVTVQGIPQPFASTISGSLGAVGPVTVAGIPDTFHINIEKLPKIQLGVDPVTLHQDPIDLNMSIKEIPNIRGHLPADFTVGLSLLGIELICVRLCGEAQVITEPYHPNPCERCGAEQTTANPSHSALQPSTG